MQGMTDDALKILADRLAKEVDQSTAAQGSSIDRWLVGRAIYNVEKEVSSLEIVEGVEPYFIPLFRQRADRIIDSMMDAFLSPSPIVQVVAEADEGQWENADDYERALQFLALQSGLRRTLRRALVEALCSDMGIMRVFPKKDMQGRVVGLDSERIRPEFCVGYPCYNTTLNECSTVGHRFELPMREVLRRQRTGEYREVTVNRGSVSEKEHASGYAVTTAVDNYVAEKEEDSLEPVVLYELITEILEGDEYKKYLCILAYDTKELLSIEPYEYPLNWYIALRIDDEDDVLWPSNSLAQRMQGLSMAFSDGITTLYQGSHAAAFPVITIKGNIGSLKLTKWRPGMLLPLSGQAEANVLQTQFNPGALPAALTEIRETADAVMGINQLGVGQALPASTRVAQIESLTESQSQAKQGYADAVSPAIQRYFQLVDMYLAAHFLDFKAVYGGKIPLESPEDVPASYRLEVTGEDMSSTPDQQIKKMQFLLELASQPISELDPVKIERRLVDELGLSFTTDAVRKDASTIIHKLLAAAEQMGIQNAPQLVATVLMEVIANAQAQQGEGAGNPAEQGMAMDQAGPIQPA